MSSSVPLMGSNRQHFLLSWFKQRRRAVVVGFTTCCSVPRLGKETGVQTSERCLAAKPFAARFRFPDKTQVWSPNSRLILSICHNWPRCGTIQRAATFEVRRKERAGNELWPPCDEYSKTVGVIPLKNAGERRIRRWSYSGFIFFKRMSWKM